MVFSGVFWQIYIDIKTYFIPNTFFKLHTNENDMQQTNILTLQNKQLSFYLISPYIQYLGC